MLGCWLERELGEPRFKMLMRGIIEGVAFEEGFFCLYDRLVDVQVLTTFEIGIRRGWC